MHIPSSCMTLAGSLSLSWFIKQDPFHQHAFDSLQIHQAKGNNLTKFISNSSSITYITIDVRNPAPPGMYLKNPVNNRIKLPTSTGERRISANSITHVLMVSQEIPHQPSPGTPARPLIAWQLQDTARACFQPQPWPSTLSSNGCRWNSIQNSLGQESQHRNFRKTCWHH